MDYIVLSIPIFFILIGVELVISNLGKTGWYRFNDAIANISCGIVQQISGVFSKTVLIVGYIYLYEHYRIFEIKENVFTWLTLFLGIDFFYYWFHRLAHEISLFWGTHIVHHQSEEYNLSVALRQSSLQGFVSMAFYFPLALVGFNPITFVTISAFQTLYQFWIHTKAIDKLPGWFEYLFNTPSHHRVHHGRNPQYIDKNHGGTLIIFDRLFGTFQPEEEDVIYGVTKPLASFNPIWANFDWYADMWRDLNRPMAWADRIKLLFKRPGWLPEYLGGYQTPVAIAPDQVEIYDIKIPNGLNYYILVQYLIVLALTSGFLFNLDQFSRVEQTLVSGFIILSTMNIGGLFDKRKWAILLESIRWIMLLLIGISVDFIPPMALVFIGILAIFSIYWLSRYRSDFLLPEKANQL